MGSNASKQKALDTRALVRLPMHPTHRPQHRGSFAPAEPGQRTEPHFLGRQDCRHVALNRRLSRGRCQRRQRRLTIAAASQAGLSPL